jgi:C4-dicarboxylate-specific signal transduction histidine kinase
MMDIIEREDTRAALSQAQAQLAHIHRVTALGELTASIVHEVNQPLAAIIANAESCLRWLGHEAPRLEEVRGAVERIISDGDRASEVIRRIRALAEKSDPQKARLDLNDVLGDAIALVQGEVLRQRVSLRIELSAALPAVLGDRIQLQQVIINLAMNGIEAMAPVMDRPRELLIRSDRDAADQALVVVQDSGIGFDPDNADRLFDAFFTTRAGGMGMGLSICRSIIEAHDGRVWAACNIGPGAAFRFTLPPYAESRS